MKKLSSHPHLFFLAMIPVCIALAFIFSKDQIVFEYFATYLVVELKFIYFFSAIFFGLISFNYFSLKWAEKPAITSLSLTHILLQCASFILLITRNHWSGLTSLENGSELNTSLYDNSSFISFVAFLLFLLATFIHLINFFTSLFRKSK